MRLVIYAAILALTTTTASAETTGNDMYAACLQDRDNKMPRSPVDNFRQGYCSGIIYGIINTSLLDDSRYICAPDGSDTSQGVAILIRYLDIHPERRHEAFFQLAFEALAAAWPCPARKK